jgi:hypothetical protein
MTPSQPYQIIRFIQAPGICTIPGMFDNTVIFNPVVIGVLAVKGPLYLCLSRKRQSNRNSSDKTANLSSCVTVAVDPTPARWGTWVYNEYWKLCLGTSPEGKYVRNQEILNV